MIPRIKYVKPLKGYLLHIVFDDGKDCIYDVKDDINTIKDYEDLENISGLFEQVQLDESRTCVFWNDYLDLASDAIYENAQILKADSDELEMSTETKMEKRSTVVHDTVERN